MKLENHVKLEIFLEGVITGRHSGALVRRTVYQVETSSSGRQCGTPGRRAGHQVETSRSLQEAGLVSEIKNVL